MTSLARQLQRLAVPHFQAVFGGDKRKVSLLFDPKEAASIDRETFYALGTNGLEELITLYEGFQEYESSLYGESSLTFERSVQTKEVNQKLDETISRFLIHLSPYCLLKPAHKALEWLIYRYHIHHYNTDALILCFLPYHESRIFIRVIQLFKFDSKTASKWDWLQPLQSSGVHLSATTLRNHCRTNPAFLNFICEMVFKALKVYDTTKSKIPQLKVLFSFYTTTIIGVLESDHVTETLVSMLLPLLSQGLRSHILDYRAASYMILSQVLHKTKLKWSLLKTLQQVLCKFASGDLLTEAVSCLLLMFQTQTDVHLTRKSFKYLLRHSTLVDIVSQLSLEYSCDVLIWELLEHLVPAAFKQSFSQATSEESSGSEFEGSLPQFLSLLHRFLAGMTLTSALAEKTAVKFIQSYVKYINKCTDQEENDKMKSSLRGIVRLLEGRYSLCVDSAVKRVMSELEEEIDRSLVQQFLNLSVLSVQHHLMAESDASLALSLNHRLPEVRQKAVEHLMKNYTEIEDEEFLHESVLLRLQDDWPQVVNAILKNGKNFWHLVTDQELVLTHIEKLFKKALYDEAWHETARFALAVLGTCECKGEVTMRIVDSVLPYCFVVFADTFCLEFIEDVCKLPQIKTNTFLSHFAQEWKSYSPAEASFGDINIKVAECIAMAAENCGPKDCLHMVQKWCQKSCDTEEPQFQCLMILVLSNLIKEPSGGKRTSQSKKTSKMEYSWILVQMIKKILKEDKMDQKVPSKVPENLVAIEIAQLVTEACSYIQVYRKVPHFLCQKALQVVIENLKVPGTLEAAPWWQYMGDGGPEDKFLQVSVCLFALLMNGASDAKDNSNRVLLIRFFKECFKNVHIVMKFLCLLWTQDCNDQRGLLGSTSALQVQALQLGLVHLHNLGNDDIVAMASSATVVLSLVLVLMNPYQGIRECGVHAVQALLRGQGDRKGPFNPLMRKIEHCSEEIASDPGYIQEVVKSVYKNTNLEDEYSPKMSRNRKTQGKEDLKRESLTSIIREVTSKTVPLFVQHQLLLIFRQVHSSGMLSGLLPLLESLLDNKSGKITPMAADSLKLLVERFTHQNISAIGPDSQGLKLFLKVLCLPSQQLWHKITPQIAAIKQVTKELFSALERTAQQKILFCLFDVWVEGNSITVTNLIRKVLKHIPMEAEHIVEELKSCLKTTEAKSMKQAKKLRRDPVEEQGDVELSEFENLEWQRKTVVLEAVHLKKRIHNYHLLLPVTFQVLARILESESHSSAEYQKQLVMSLLYNLCMQLEQELTLGGKPSVGSDKFNMDLIVNCIRSSDNPQTHQQALLVLTAAAKIYPEHLLHNVMSVFTFIGANILRQDDAYSFHVISRILETVIPALITACEQRKRVPKDITNDVEDVITMVIQVFVDAYPHIPGHRRHMLFTQLLTVVGGGSYLWRTLLLVMELVVTKRMPHSGATSEEEESSAMLPSQDLEFCLSQCSQFSSSVQITSAVHMLKYISKLPNDKDDGKSSQKRSPKSLGKLRKDEAHIFSLETHTARQLRHFKYATVCLLVAMFSGEEFISLMVSTEERELLDSARKILETTLEFICQVSLETTAAGASQGHKATIRFLKALQHKSYDLLDKVVSLFPERVFIEVVSSLVSHPLSSIRRKALDLLNIKLQGQREEIDKRKEKLLLPVVDRLVTLIQESVVGADITEESLINGQTAFISLKLLCKILGDKHPPTFIQVLKMSVEVFTGNHGNQQVSACALLCLAEICSTLKVHIIQHLPLFMPKLLTILRKEEALFRNELYLLSVLTTVSRVTENLAHFLSPYLTDILFHECVLLGAEVEVLNKPQLQLRLKAIRQSLATLLPSRVLLPAILTCYERLLQERLACVSALLQLLGDHICHISKEELTHHLTTLHTFFFTCLDLRGQEQNQVSHHKVEEIEGVAIETIITMVMKLSEATFRPFLFKLFDWATRDDEQRFRIVVFYRMADRLADSLRSLFTLFAGHIIQHAASMLNQNCKAKSGTRFFPEDRKKRKKSCQLLVYILNCLHKCFLYDTEGFVNKERFDSLMQPLVDQIENEQGNEEMYQSRISEHLVPCIIQFAVAAQDDSLWKSLNYQILLKTRHSAAKVRFAALLTIDELHKKLGEDYMTLLPETIPFLAELMEDESEQVEKKCRAVIVQMEKTLGEPLQKYF